MKNEFWLVPGDFVKESIYFEDDVALVVMTKKCDKTRFSCVFLFSDRLVERNVFINEKFSSFRRIKM